MKYLLLCCFFILWNYKLRAQTCTLEASVASSGTVSCSGSGVTLTVSANRGTPPYRYSWSTGQTTSSISVNSGGTYTVSVTDADPDCQAVVTAVTIGNSNAPASPTAAGASTCPNGSVTLTASAPGGDYQWYDAPVGGTLVASGESFTTPALSANTTYYVETSISGCSSTRAAVLVQVIDFLTVTGSTVCAGNSAMLRASGGDSYQWYDAPSGGTLLGTDAQYITAALNESTTYYVTAVRNGCEIARKPVTATVVPLPEAPTVPGTSFCGSGKVTLSVTSPGDRFDWYTTPTGGTSLISSPDYTTPLLTQTTTFYVQTYAGNCASPRTAVTVTIYPVPDPPVATGQTICPGTSALLTATAGSGTLRWYDANLTLVATGDSFQTPALEKTTTYWVQSTNEYCSNNTAVTVRVQPRLPLPSAPGVIICPGNAATLTASAQQGTFEWYDAPDGGNLLSSNARYTTPTLKAGATYYVQNIVNGCSSARTATTVAILPEPAAPIVASVRVCSGSSATLTATGGSGSYQWYDAAAGGTLLSGSASYTTPALSSNATYYVQMSTDIYSCTSTRTAVTVSVDPIPVAPTAADVTTCPGTSATLTASAGGTISWYSSPTGNSALASGTSFTTPPLQESTTYFAESSANGCRSTRTPVRVNVTSVTEPAFFYSSARYCVSSPNPTPIIQDAAAGTFSSSPSGLVFVSNTTGEIDLAASRPGQYVISLLINGNCPRTSSANLEVYTGATDASFSYPGPYCRDVANPLPTFTNGKAGTFTASPAGLTFVNSSTGEINLSASTPGTYTITNTINGSGACPGGSATNIVTINSVPLVQAGPDRTVSTGMAVQLNGSYSGATGIRWSGGGGAISNPTITNPVYTPAAGETRVTLTLSTTGGTVCPRSDQIIIIFQGPTAEPGTPNAPTASGTTVCYGNTARLSATAPGGSYQWYDQPSGGRLLMTGPVYTTPALTQDITYYVQTTMNGQTSARTAVNVTVSGAPPVASGQTVCFDQAATLRASGSTGSYQWYDASTGGNLLSTSDTYTTTFLLTNTSYYVQTTTGSCISARTRVDVTVNPFPVVTSASTLTTCNATPLQYQLTGNVAGIDYQWSRDAVPGISNGPVFGQTSSLINETLINTSEAPINVTYMITPFIQNCAGEPFVLTVSVYPGVTVTSPPTKNICNSTVLGYTLTVRGINSGFSWSRAAVNGISNAAVTDQGAATIRETLVNTSSAPVEVTYTYQIASPNCPVTTFNLVVTVNPNAFITSAPSGETCSGEVFSYHLTSSSPFTNYNWSRMPVPNISNAAVFNQTGDMISETLINTADLPVAVTYQVLPSVNGCPASPFTYTMTVNPQPVTPVISSNSPVCEQSSIRLNTPAFAGGTYRWTGPNGFNSTLQNPVITGVTQLNAGTYHLSVTSASGCRSADGTVEIRVNAPPTALAGTGQTVCSNTPGVALHGQIGGGTTTGIWTSSGTGAFIPSATALDAHYIPSSADLAVGQVQLTLSSTSADDCNPAHSSLAVNFVTAPEVNAGEDRDVCRQDLSLQLQGDIRFATSFHWSTSGTGRFSPSATVPSPVYMMSSADLRSGSVKLTLAASNATCSDVTDQINIRFLPPPIINAGQDETILKGEKLVLHPSVLEGNVSYLWLPNTGMDNNTLKNPTVTGNRDITYTLKVTDNRGCVTEDQVSITVLDPVQVYNTFSPNGDGVNDTWNIPTLARYPNATVEVFNRYGSRVFYTTGYGKPWDGTAGGKLLPSGTYYYIIDTKFENRVLSGYVTILR